MVKAWPGHAIAAVLGINIKEEVLYQIRITKELTMYQV